MRTVIEFEQVHRRAADEAGGEQGRRPLVEFGGRAVLLDAAGAHQDDAVGHAHGLGLVMGHIDHGDAEPLLQAADLAAQLLPELGIEIGERLVEQADRRLGDQRAAERDALLLAAGELRGLAPQQRFQPEQRRDPVEPRAISRLRRAAHRQTEGDVVGDGQMREQGVGLEHHGDAARRAGQAADIAALDFDHAGRPARPVRRSGAAASTCRIRTDRAGRRDGPFRRRTRRRRPRASRPRPWSPIGHRR